MPIDLTNYADKTIDNVANNWYIGSVLSNPVLLGIIIVICIYIILRVTMDSDDFNIPFKTYVWIGILITSFIFIHNMIKNQINKISDDDKIFNSPLKSNIDNMQVRDIQNVRQSYYNNPNIQPHPPIQPIAQAYNVNNLIPTPTPQYRPNNISGGSARLDSSVLKYL